MFGKHIYRVEMHHVNFANSDLDKSVLTIPLVVFFSVASDGKLLVTGIVTVKFTCGCS